MIPKPVVMQIAEQVNKNGQAADGLMQFTFKRAVCLNVWKNNEFSLEAFP